MALPSLGRPFNQTQGARAVKAFLKTLTWRTVGTVEMLAVGWFTTGKVTAAVGLAVAAFFYKGVLFFGHEMLWEKSWKAA
jgi:uncharacterized membrane protein